MTTDPRVVRAAVQAAEVRLQALVEPGEQALHGVTDEVAAIRKQASGTREHLYRRLEAAQRELQGCLAAQRNSDRPIDCSRYYDQVNLYRGLLSELDQLIARFEQTASHYMGDAAQFRTVLHNHIPTACHWLRERDAALARFETSGGLASGSGSLGSTGRGA